MDEVTRFLPYDTWRVSADGVAWYERMLGLQAAGSALQLVITEREANIAIGSFLVFNIDRTHRRAEIGYVLGRAWWGRGFLREALGAMQTWAFETQQAHRLEATIDPRNTRSANVLTACGFVPEGLQRSRWCNKGQWQDSALFGCLREEWARQAHANAASLPAQG